MKKNSRIPTILMATFFAASASIAGAELSTADILSRAQSSTIGCQKEEIGAITKVDIVTGKQVRKIARGVTGYDQAKLYAIVYSQRGKEKSWELYPDPVAETVKASDLTAKLLGKPACVAEPQ